MSFPSLDRRMLDTTWGAGQTGPLLAHRSSARTRSPSRPCQVLLGLSRQARDRKTTVVLKSFERGHTKEKKGDRQHLGFPHRHTAAWNLSLPRRGAQRCAGVLLVYRGRER